MSTSLKQSVALCRQVTAQYDRTFYLSSHWMSLPQRQALWAVYAWFRQRDELIDGRSSRLDKQEALDQWVEQLKTLFDSGQIALPTDIALVDAIQRYDLPMQPFLDMLLGQQMDLQVDRYQTWEDLQRYCYCVAGTVGLVSAYVLGLGVRPESTDALINLSIAMQLTNILQDVGADARRKRIYLPLEDLQQFDYSEEDLLSAVLDQRWISLMKYEIDRAYSLYQSAESGMATLPKTVRWPMWMALILYRQDLQAIARKGYQVFGDRPRKPLWWTFHAIVSAWRQAYRPPT